MSSSSKKFRIMQNENNPPAITTVSSASASASLIANNIDLLTKIMLLLPIESLLNFKSVSWHWYTLITSHDFTNLRTPFPKTPSGLFLRTFSSFNNTPYYNFINLISPNIKKTLFSCGEYSLAFVKAKEPSGIKILQSCNGLFLCSSSLCNPREAHYYICNPTTCQYSKIPQKGLNKNCLNIVGVSLAFDPSISPHYKLVCVSRESSTRDLYRIRIFSSNKGSWSVSNCGSFSASNATEFNLGVFCNGAIHWYSTFGGTSLCFNIDEDCVKHVPVPPRQGNWGKKKVDLYYFGTCWGHLHLIQIYDPRTLQFSVYEMEKDYSCWFVKYNVDLNALPIAFPKMIRDDLAPWNLNYYVFSVLYVVESEVDEDSYLVLNTPGKVVRYNFKDKSFYELCDIGDTREDIGTVSSIMIGPSHAYQYFECFSHF